MIRVLSREDVRQALPMHRAIEETRRRRRIQLEYNRKHRIIPRTIVKTAQEILQATSVADSGKDKEGSPEEIFKETEYEDMLARLEREMMEAAGNLEFEKAASLRDRMEDIIAMMAIQGSRSSRSKSDRSKARRRRGRKS